MRIISLIIVFSTILSCSKPGEDLSYPEPDGTNDLDMIEEEDDQITPADNNSEDDKTDQSNDEDIEETDDNDTITITPDHDFTSDPCLPNPCIMENSDGNCFFAGERFKCGCVEGYLWDGSGCSEDPCKNTPCKDIENSTGSCEVDETGYKCTCLGGFFWDGNECLEIPDIVFVDETATGTNDGTSWENAFTDFTDALESISNSNVLKWVWVAKGTYSPKKALRIHSEEPCADGKRCHNFTLLNNVSIICGFSGDETKLEQRDWVSNETIFSGDVDGDGTLSEGDTYNLFFNFDIDETAIMDGCYIEGGNANYENLAFDDWHTKHGGGMYNISKAHPTIKNTTFRYNFAYIQGAGMMNNNGSNPTIENCHFENNEAFKGAALSNNLSSPVIINSTFIDNIAFEGYGGAVFNIQESSPQFFGCTFSGNEANDGGAVISTDRCDTVFKDCIFTNNLASRNGGAIGIAYQSKGKVEDCLFESNFSKLGGGAIEIYYNSSPTILNTRFVQNDVTENGDGGGILMTDSNPLIINSLFIGNSATNGGALANRNSTPNYINNTISFNLAESFGGGIYSETSSETTVLNSIVFYNEPDNIKNEGGDTIFYDSNIEDSFSGEVWDEDYGQDKGGNIDTAPMFTNIANGDFSLSEDSFCINAGSNTPYESGELAGDIKFDLLGHDRIIDGTVDMGVFETLLLPEGLYLMNEGF